MHKHARTHAKRATRDTDVARHCPPTMGSPALHVQHHYDPTWHSVQPRVYHQALTSGLDRLPPALLIHPHCTGPTSLVETPRRPPTPTLTDSRQYASLIHATYTYTHRAGTCKAEARMPAHPPTCICTQWAVNRTDIRATLNRWLAMRTVAFNSRQTIDTNSWLPTLNCEQGVHTCRTAPNCT